LTAHDVIDTEENVVAGFCSAFQVTSVIISVL